VQIGVAGAPVNLGKAKVQIAQRTTGGHVGQRKVRAGAKTFVGQALAHGLQGCGHAAHLPVDPGAAALLSAAARPSGFQPRQDGRVDQAVGQRFPGAHFNALAAHWRYQLAHR
jgi:hypothetical protein